MFGLLRFRYKIWSLEKDIRKISKAYETDIKNARKQKASSAEMESIRQGKQFELSMANEEIMEAHTDWLSEIAHRLMIPIPNAWEESGKDKWVEGTAVRRYLNEHGMSEVRAAIRAERKARAELIVMWVPMISGVAGLIGTFTGLVAVYMKLK